MGPILCRKCYSCVSFWYFFPSFRVVAMCKTMYTWLKELCMSPLTINMNVRLYHIEPLFWSMVDLLHLRMRFFWVFFDLSLLPTTLVAQWFFWPMVTLTLYERQCMCGVDRRVWNVWCGIALVGRTSFWQFSCHRHCQLWDVGERCLKAYYQTKGRILVNVCGTPLTTHEVVI